MYTQCQHCQAIFEVSMREVTVASGKLRCSECKNVFDAMASLSTNLPDSFSEQEKAKAVELKAESIKDNAESSQRATTSTPDNANIKTHRPDFVQASGVKENIKEMATDINKTIDRKWVKPIVIGLSVLLLAQVLYSNRQYFSRAPTHQPDKIKMLSNNVFAHPNEAGVLLISASIENKAEQDQPFPTLEVRLTDETTKLIALRRFKPAEYLKNYHTKMLLKANTPVNLKLKIADPGNQATRFQFKFL